MPKIVVSFTPQGINPAAEIPVNKASITVTIGGTAQPPVDTAGPPIQVTCNVGDVVSNTETVTNVLGFTSKPSPKSPDLTVSDPTPDTPPPATMAIVSVIPDAPAGP